MLTKNIIRQIAKNNGVSAREVEKDIKEAICIGMSSSNPEIKDLWGKIATDGKEPSIDKLLGFCVSQAIMRRYMIDE